jgi:hypothetical protein
MSPLAENPMLAAPKTPFPIHDSGPVAGSDDLAKKEERGYDEDRRKLENTDLANTIEARKKYSQWLIVGTGIWLGCIVFVVVVQVFTKGLSDTVMVTLLTTTTVEVISVLIAVVRYLFPVPNK